MNTSSLQLIEIFFSIQGETSFSGLPTTFIRLAACNLRCSWCDTSYSFGRGETWQIHDIISKVQTGGCRHVCITGGEPLLQENVYVLIQNLCDLGYVCSIETGGSLPISKIDPRAITILDIKCPGSAMSHKNDWNNLSNLNSHDEIKFVILDRIDYDFAKDICEKYQLFARSKEVLLSPVHGKLDAKLLVNWILEDQLQNCRLNLQLHKFIWDPLQRGV